MQRIWKDYYEDLDNINSQEQAAVHICGFDGIWRGNYFGGEPLRRIEIEISVRKPKI